MRSMIAIAIIAAAFSSPVYAQSELERGFAGALRGCEEWVLNPASWSNGTGPFVSAVGLGDKMGLVDQVDEATLPPKPLRTGNIFWRINSTASAGYVLIVSDRLPMCHITGGGNADLQPVISSVLASPAFTSRWKLVKEIPIQDMASSEFQNIAEPAFSIVISRASKPGERLDRVQIFATAVFKTSK